MNTLFETVSRPAFWSTLWADIKELMLQGTPPVYVQLLLVTVAFLAYRLFFHDSRRDYNRSLFYQAFHPSKLIYAFAVMVIVAGGFNGLKEAANPEALVDGLRHQQQKIDNMFPGR